MGQRDTHKAAVRFHDINHTDGALKYPYLYVAPEGSGEESGYR